jgi:3-deoxy-D-manno-octulosonic-acid transferase
MKPFTLFYFLLSLLLYVAAVPFLLIASFKTKYKRSVPSRFFLWNNPSFTRSGTWFHVCSLGESRALKPLLELLGEENVNITTTTQTGFEEAKKYRAEVRYLPFELFLPFWVTKQKTLVILEAEFWYMLFVAAAFKGSKVVLLNARISERSFDKYLKLSWFYARMFAYADAILVQGIDDKERFERLGAKNVEVLGNIKLAQKIVATKAYEKSDVETIVAASTHKGEEAMIVSEFVSYAKEHKSKLIVVPRHPERFDDVWQLIETVSKKNGFTCKRFSQSQDFDAEIVLVDAMGELNNIYAISDIAILGGAFAPIGGHNPLEPATFGCKIITGKNHFLQLELFKHVAHVQFCELHEIKEKLIASHQLPGSKITETIDLKKVVEIIG